MTQTVSVNQVKINCFSGEEELFRSLKSPCKVFSVNPLNIVEFDKNRYLYQDSVNYIDGTGLALLIWLYYSLKRSPLRGADIWLGYSKSLKPQSRIAMIGARKEVLTQAVLRYQKDFPDLQVVYSHDGYFKNEELLINDLKQARPDVVFVCLGTPFQEKVITTLIRHCPAIYFGLGGSFDVYSGHLKRAPAILRKNGLEWLWRWIQEPVLRTKKNIFLANFLLNAITFRYKK